MPRILSFGLVVLILTASVASAHKVILSVYPSGAMLEGELGLSNGDMSEDQLIEVFDERDNKIGETKTDGDGFFTYQPTQAGAHIFRANLGAGHVAETTVAVDQVEAPSGGTQAAAISPSAVSTPKTIVPSSLVSPDREAVAKMIRNELRPLRQEIAAYKEKNDLQSILGGIGYIVGIFGLGMYVAARRKLKGLSS